MGQRPGRPGRWTLAAALVLAIALLAPAAAAPPATAQPPGSHLDPADLADPDVYPARGFWDIKGVTSFFAGLPDEDELLATMGMGRLDTSWARFEPQVVTPPCPAGRAEYDLHCFVIDAQADSTIRRFTEAGLPVMAIVFATPAWARGEKPCDPFNAWHDVFCVPDDPDDFARFAGFLAERYDGTHGAGRITDFVIQNEVNLNQWFNIGCGKGIPCDFDTWIHTYADLYDRAYDAIRSHQAHAKVMIPLTQHFETSFDAPELVHPMWSVKTFLPPLVPLLGDREWSIAHHPYPRSVDPTIDARDLPYATMGDVGVLSGWLRATFPDDPQAWEVELTEQGMNNPGIFDDLQAESLCDAFRGVLGTPGIRSFLYHSLKDNPGEFGLALGLHDQDGNPKPALAVWRDANDPGHPTCGFENFPDTVVREGVATTTGEHWVSSRPLPRGYWMLERQWRLRYEQEPGTELAYECGNGDASATPPTFPDATFLSRAVDCGGGYPMGPVGWIHTAPAAGRSAIFTCGAGDDRRTGVDPCGAGIAQELVGYAVVEDVPPDVLEEERKEEEPPPDPVDPTSPEAPDLSGYDVVFALDDGGFRIGRLSTIPVPDGDPETEGRAYLAGTWDEATGALDVDLLVPSFTVDVQTTLLPDPIPTTMTIEQVGGGTGTLDPATGALTLDLTVDTELSSPVELFRIFLGEDCHLGPAAMTMTTGEPFDLSAEAPRATLTASGFPFPGARGCGTGGDLDATLNPALGLPTDDTDASMTFTLVQGLPEPPPDPDPEPEPEPTTSVPPTAAVVDDPDPAPPPPAGAPPSAPAAVALPANPRFTG